MELTTNQIEYLKPVFEMYESYLISGSGHFNDFQRVMDVYKENNEPIKPCMNCPEDKLQYIKHLYNVWKNQQ